MEIPAANDANFRLGPSRTLPVRVSMRGIPGYPRSLVIYRIAASRFWQVRVFHAGRLICRSTREETLGPAIAFAERFYSAVTRGEPTFHATGYFLGRGQALHPGATDLSAGEAVRSGCLANVVAAQHAPLVACDATEGTPDGKPAQAIALAPAFLGKLLASGSLPPESKRERVSEGDGATFRWIAERFMLREAARRDRGEFAELSFRADRIRLDNRILPFLGDLPVSKLDARGLENFLLSLEAHKLSSTSLSLYLMTLRKVLRYAVSQGIIAVMPILPRVRIRKTSRGSFTPSEYFRLLRRARSAVGMMLHEPDLFDPGDPADPAVRNSPTAAKERSSRNNEPPLVPRRDAYAKPRFWILPKYWKVPPDLPWVISFMVNSFIRPSDLKTLRHRHVEVVRGEHTYLRLTLPETKAHDKPIVTLRPAVRVYETLQRYHGAHGMARPDDFLFFPRESNRNYALAVLGWMFRRLLEELDLRLGPHGNPRTLYSLRHTAITFRLLYGHGIDILTLARNARTSVEMIEKHYASTLTGERNISMLQSKRTVRRS